MEASVGDRVVVAGAVLGAPVRDGEILEVRGQHGGPPYLVRWSDTGRETLFFPGPDSHVDHFSEAGPAEPSTESTPRPTPVPSATAPVKTWQVDVYLYEGDDDTAAHAVLRTGASTRVDGRGKAHRSPQDHDVPEIGDEIAAARALRRLANRLLGVASDDIAALEGHPVELKA